MPLETRRERGAAGSEAVRRTRRSNFSQAGRVTAGGSATEKVEAREGGEAEHQQRMLSREERKAEGLEEGLVVLVFV